MPNVYLTGMMGSGKSVTGKRLAARLHCDFADLDEIIQEKCGRSISAIFEKDGEAFFRELEAAALLETASVSPRVVATGGGVVLRPDNVDRMRQTGKIVYLETSPEILWQRVKEKRDRPLLKTGDPREALLAIYKSRLPLYEKHQDFRVLTDGKSADQVAVEILECLKQGAGR